MPSATSTKRKAPKSKATSDKNHHPTKKLRPTPPKKFKEEDVDSDTSMHDEEQDNEDSDMESDNVVSNSMAEDNYMEDDSIPLADSGGSKQSSKEAHKIQKSLRIERKTSKPYFEITKEAKSLWEQLISKKLSNEEKRKLMEKLTGLIKGRVKEFAFKHDTSRIIQAYLKHGNASQRYIIVEELKGSYMELSKSTYGRFIVIKCLEFCPKARSDIISSFYGKIPSLVRHQFAAQVLQEAYAQYATATQRMAMVEEFYGPEFSLFRSNDKSSAGRRSLDDILKDNPAKKQGILKYLLETLTGILDKGTIGASIVHRAMLEFVKHADEKGIQEITELLKEQIYEILHTKEGVHVAMIIVSYASPKDRKAILKAIKPWIIPTCKDEYGHLIFLRIFDVVDDTVLIDKIILRELTKALEKEESESKIPESGWIGFLEHKFARRVIMYLLVGRNARYFSKETMHLLAEGDAIRTKTSKKDPSIRSRELLEAISPTLLDVVQRNVSILLHHNFGSQAVREIMLHAIGDKMKAMNAILDLCGEDPKQDNHVILEVFSSRTIKSLIKADHAEKEDDRSVAPIGFAKLLLQKIKPNLLFFAKNLGSFIIVALAEVPETKAETLRALKPDKKIVESVAEKGNKGAEILAGYLR